jgi:hypothetical protein
MSSAELFTLIALATVGTFTPGPNHTAKRLQWFNRLMALATYGSRTLSDCGVDGALFTANNLIPRGAGECNTSD